MMDEIDVILRERQEPQAASNLSFRIAQAAQDSASAKDTWWDDIQRELATWIFLPQPAYVMAVCLLIGLVFGFEMGGALDAQSYDIASFMDFDAGDWS